MVNVNPTDLATNGSLISVGAVCIGEGIDQIGRGNLVTGCFLVGVGVVCFLVREVIKPDPVTVAKQ